jgi:hypothetical protein
MYSCSLAQLSDLPRRMQHCPQQHELALQLLLEHAAGGAVAQQLWQGQVTASQVLSVSGGSLKALRRHEVNCHLP